MQAGEFSPVLKVTPAVVVENTVMGAADPNCVCGPSSYQQHGWLGNN
jgi:hypothetical protein